MTARTETERMVVAFINRRNGAYLVSMIDPSPGEKFPDELYDCASSVVVAKRLARESAIEFGYTGPFRWKTDDSSVLLLEATLTFTWGDNDEDG
jgi:hypothetical protein